MDIIIFKKGIPSTTLKGKWRNLLLVVHKFVTCEGRFGCMFFYQIHLIMHFLKEIEINLHYFLLNSLRKTYGNVHKRIQFIENTMYHHALIKILIEFHLDKRLLDNFLVRNHVKEEDEEAPSCSKEKRGRKRISENAIKSLPQQQLKEQSEDETPIAEILGSIKR